MTRIALDGDTVQLVPEREGKNGRLLALAFGQPFKVIVNTHEVEATF